MHAASVAANAIVQLYRDQAVSRIGELHRQILVFSISHDHVWVKIHGHYARIEGDEITLHRYCIRSFDISDQNGKEKWTTYHIVRKIYDYFAPIHLQRIRDAIEQLPTESSLERSSTSLASGRGVDDDVNINAILQAELDVLKTQNKTLKEQVHKLLAEQKED